MRLLRTPAFLAPAGFLVFFGIAEIGVRVWVRQAAHGPLLTSLGDRARLVRTLELRATEIETDDWSSPIRYDPEFGWRNAPGVFKPSDAPAATNNRQGWRDSREYGDRPPPGVVRVGVYGDSNTWGYDVADGQPWPNQLARRLPQADVLNLAVPGYGHGQILRLAERTAAPMEVHVAVLGFTQTDVDRNHMAVFSWPKPWFELQPDGTLIDRGVPVPPLRDLLAAYHRRPRLADALTILVEHLTTPTLSVTDDPLTTAIIARFHTSMEAAGAVPVLTLLPSTGEGGLDPTPMLGEIARRCAEGRWRCVDPIDRFRDLTARGISLNGPISHLSPEAYGALADATAEALIGWGLVPSEPGAATPEPPPAP